MRWSYVRALLLSAAGTVALGAILTLVVDPYGLYRWVEIDGLNKIKPKGGVHGQLVKPYRVLAVRPRTLILGNSRSEAGVDPGSSVWPDELRPVYNMAMPAMGIDTAIRSLEHVIASGSKPVMVIAGVDFFDFLQPGSPRAQVPAQAPQPTELERRLLTGRDGPPNRDRFLQVLKDHGTMLFSLNSLIDSLQTLVMQRFPDQSDLTALGFNPMTEFTRFVRVDGHHVMFRQVNTTYLRSYLRANPTIYSPGHQTSIKLEQVRKLVHICRAAGIRLALYIHPYHAHMLESYRISGLWPAFEEWKRALLKTLAAEALESPANVMVPLWDFSGYNAITTEAVPGASERGRAMNWYWEAGHYKGSVGDLMVPRILGLTAGTSQEVPAFGTLLTQDRIESHLQTLRESRQGYADRYAGDVEALEKLAGSIKVSIEARKPQ